MAKYEVYVQPELLTEYFVVLENKNVQEDLRLIIGQQRVAPGIGFVLTLTG